MKVYVDIYRGFICKNLNVQFIYSYENNPESKYKTYSQGNNWGSIRHSYSFSIRTAYGDKTGLFITDKQFGAFRTLLKNSIKLISEHLYELFPKIGSTEFEISDKALDRFVTEKAQSSMNITIIPSVYATPAQETFPGIHIDDGRGGAITIPLEDAVAMYETLKSLDVINLSMQVLNELKG